MADYYSHNDPRRKGNDQYLDYDTGSGAKWIWAGIVLVAFIALIALGSSGSGPVATDGVATTDGAAPAVAAEPEAAPTVPITE